MVEKTWNTVRFAYEDFAGTLGDKKTTEKQILKTMPIVFRNKQEVYKESD